MTVKPNLFIVGAGKAGTYSLYEYLKSHPQAYMSPVKEPNFFGGEKLCMLDIATIYMLGWIILRTLLLFKHELEHRLRVEFRSEILALGEESYLFFVF